MPDGGENPSLSIHWVILCKYFVQIFKFACFLRERGVQEETVGREEGVDRVWSWQTLRQQTLSPRELIIPAAAQLSISRCGSSLSNRCWRTVQRCVLCCHLARGGAWEEKKLDLFRGFSFTLLREVVTQVNSGTELENYMFFCKHSL